MRFRDRSDAGRRLAAALAEYSGEACVIYGLPRGGVVPALEVARALGAPLDLLIARKVGHPLVPEYAVAAVAASGDVVANQAEVAKLDPEWFRREVKRQAAEAERRRKRYLGGRPPAEAENKIAILVDDGIATGLTMKAAILEAKRRRPRAIVVAVPVAPRDTVAALEALVDRVVCLHAPKDFEAIGQFYDVFDQVGDEQVVALLQSTAPNAA
jgi:putative phosphoribosyl transferase